MAWHPTGVALDSMARGSSREVHLGSASVLLVRISDEVRAVGPICSHEGGILADGELHGARLVCPEHIAAFDVLSGKVLTDPHGIEPPTGRIDPLPVYRTRIVDGLIEVELDA